MRTLSTALVGFLLLSTAAYGQPACATHVDLRWYLPDGALVRDPLGQPISSNDFPMVQIIKNRFGEIVWQETAKKKFSDICLITSSGEPSEGVQGDYFVFWAEIPRTQGAMVRVYPKDGTGCVLVPVGAAPIFQSDKVTNDSERSLKQAFKETLDFLRTHRKEPALKTIGCVSPEVIENPTKQATDRPPDGSSELSAAPLGSQSILEISSTPVGADIELDGRFVGNTPSSLAVSVGEHTIQIRKLGYEPWERRINALAGKITLSADLKTEEKPK